MYFIFKSLVRGTPFFVIAENSYACHTSNPSKGKLLSSILYCFLFSERGIGTRSEGLYFSLPSDFFPKCVDASLSVNSSILENSSYGSFTFTPQLLFFYDGTFYANMQSAIDANSGLEGIIDTNSEAIKFNATSVGSFVQITRDTTKMIQNITLS